MSSNRTKQTTKLSATTATMASASFTVIKPENGDMSIIFKITKEQLTEVFDILNVKMENGDKTDKKIEETKEKTKEETKEETKEDSNKKTKKEKTKKETKKEETKDDETGSETGTNTGSEMRPKNASWADDEESTETNSWVGKVKETLTQEEREIEKARVETLQMEEVKRETEPMMNEVVMKNSYDGIYYDSQIIFGLDFMPMLSQPGYVLGNHVGYFPTDKIEKHDPLYFKPPVGDNIRVFIIHGMTPSMWYIAQEILHKIIVVERRPELSKFYNFKPKMLNAWFFAFDVKDTKLFANIVLDTFLNRLPMGQMAYKREVEFIEHIQYIKGIRPYALDCMVNWTARFK